MSASSASDTRERALRQRHLAFGWCTVLFFLAVGVVLEALHALKLDAYLAPANEVRRLLFTLAHAHGTLLGILNLAYAASLRDASPGRLQTLAKASPLLIAGSLLLPLGFLLGGIWIHDGDPGLLVLLVPPGAVLLLVAVGLCAWAFVGRD